MNLLLDTHVALWAITDNDPFDRLLIAQAMVEPMRLLTRDALVAQYSESIVLV